MEPLLCEVFDWLTFDHAPVADEGDLVDAKPGFDLGDLRRKGLRRCNYSAGHLWYQRSS
jgi:hypothetical protein